jgi:large subunit ribosomal protein L21
LNLFVFRPESYSIALADGVGPVRKCFCALLTVALGARETISAGAMFAVIRTGGKQYKVAANDVISVEKLAGEPGETVELAEVLMIGEGAVVTTGTPLLTGAAVAATVVEQIRAPKIIVFKKKRRKNYRRKKGHRQHQTVLRITEIRGAGVPQPDEEIAGALQTEEQVVGAPQEKEPTHGA